MKKIKVFPVIRRLISKKSEEKEMAYDVYNDDELGVLNGYR